MELGKLLTSKITLGFLIIVLVVVCILVGYAISRDAEVSFSKDKWLTITPKGDTQIQELMEKVANSVSIDEYNELADQYQKLKKEHQQLSHKLTEIEQIVLPNVKDRNAVVPKIQLLFSRARDLERDIKYSYSVISSEIAQNGTINTKRPAVQQGRRDLYRHVQKCLSSIGAYDGECNGDQFETYKAVVEFQRSNNLTVDGIIGEQTWRCIVENFEQAKLD